MPRTLTSTLSLFLCFLSAASCASPSSRHEDRVVAGLPGQPQELQHLRQYSGFLSGGSDRHLHYWFIESESSPSADPLILWFNGGPGCSSLEGALDGNGPFLLDSSHTLQVNPFRWTRFANLLFLESPAGVGFSYRDSGLGTNKHTRNNVYATNDSATAAANVAAVSDFFKRHPRFRSNQFFIAGESYAAVYVSMLAAAIMRQQQHQQSIPKVTGYMIGNGASDQEIRRDAGFYSTYYYGLVGLPAWNAVLDACCTNHHETGAHAVIKRTASHTLVQKRCLLTRNMKRKAACRSVLQPLDRIAYGSAIFIYGVNQDCKGVERESRNGSGSRNDVSWRTNAAKNPSVSKGNPCSDDEAITAHDPKVAYLNRGTVRRAFHIPDAVQRWSVCSQAVSKGYQAKKATVAPEIKQLAKAGVRGLMYNGDTDLSCGWLSAMWFLEGLGIKSEGKLRPWFVDHQAAGLTIDYGSLLTRATVLGSGHMVLSDKPRQAFALIQRFLNQQPL